jgi:hypothetical protein
MVRFLLILVLLIAVLVLIAFVVGYNKVRGAAVRVDEALGGIDVQLTRRASLIPSLVSTVQAFASHERAVLDHVTDARAALTSATAGKSVAERSAAENRLISSIPWMFVAGAAGVSERECYQTPRWGVPRLSGCALYSPAPRNPRSRRCGGWSPRRATTLSRCSAVPMRRRAGAPARRRRRWRGWPASTTSRC